VRWELCLNRANSRLAIFAHEGDFAAFERGLAQAVSRDLSTDKINQNYLTRG
jgi:hypothetical protein